MSLYRIAWQKVSTGERGTDDIEAVNQSSAVMTFGATFDRREYIIDNIKVIRPGEPPREEPGAAKQFMEETARRVGVTPREEGLPPKFRPLMERSPQLGTALGIIEKAYGCGLKFDTALIDARRDLNAGHIGPSAATINDLIRDAKECIRSLEQAKIILDAVRLRGRG